MSDTPASLSHQIGSATDLQSVVRTMKAMAASRANQCDNAVRALADYERTVHLALTASLRSPTPPWLADHPAAPPAPSRSAAVIAVVFGTDQGLVGQFNETLAEVVAAQLAPLPGQTEVWTVGARMPERLTDLGLTLGESFALPSAMEAITPLVGRILVALEKRQKRGWAGQVLLFHHQPQVDAGHAPARQHLLPLDEAWQRTLIAQRWPTAQLPEVLSPGQTTLLALVREYLFVSLFRACAQSMASENASRLSAMQRAEKNIDELLDDLRQGYNRLRQGSIDEELFDLIAGFEALSPPD